MVTGASADRGGVLVVAVTHDSAPVIGGLLGSLDAGLAGVPGWRLVVVDSGSVDESLPLVRALRPDAVTLELDGNLGFAAGINAAIDAHPDCEAVLVVNPDARLDNGAAAALLDCIRAGGADIAVPQLRSASGALQWSLRRFPRADRAIVEAIIGGHRAARLGLGEIVADPRSYAEEHEIEWASGAVMMISRRALDRVGAFDDSFFLYSEETDFFLRVREAGGRAVYTPRATAEHVGGESMTSPELFALLTANRVELQRRRSSRATAAVFACAIVLNSLLRVHRRTHRAALRRLLAPPRRPSEGSIAHVCFSAQDWWYHNRAHSDFQLMRRVAQHRPVMLVNSITMRMPLPGRSTMFLKRILRKAASTAKLHRRPVSDLPDFHVVSPVILPLYGSALGRRVNQMIVTAQIRFWCRRLGFRRLVVTVTIPTAWPIARALRPEAVVYNRSDKHSAFGETDQAYIRGLEAEMLEDADLVCYVSRSLLEAERPIVGDRGHFLDHGVDFDHFVGGAARVSPEIAAIPHPRIGFFGGLDDYIVDFELLDRVATEVSDAHLVLVGDATCSLGPLAGRPNVHWLGHRPYEEIPSVGAGFDVALMPWLQNEWIEHSNPIKLKEYLALGLPVVSTDFPEVHAYSDVIEIASDSSTFVHLTRSAVARASSAEEIRRRRARVATSSWDSKAQEYLAVAESKVA